MLIAHFINEYFFQILFAIVLALRYRDVIPLAFYRSYFRQKQRNAGKDPDVVERGEFPAVIYWLAFKGRK